MSAHKHPLENLASRTRLQGYADLRADWAENALRNVSHGQPDGIFAVD
jgi:hypothetical protein